MENKVQMDTKDLLAMIDIMRQTVETGVSPLQKSEKKMSRLAVYLLTKADYEITNPDGIPIEKSAIDESTLDFTRSRTLSEEAAKQAISFVFNRSPYLQLFNTRIVNKLVTSVQAKAITSKNLISNEQNGATVSVINKRIVHNFGINLYLKHCQLQKDIPLQTVIDNLWNPGFETEVMNDVATALSNDILLLAMNGLGGNYANTEDFYDLNKGFVPILQASTGHSTNSYDSITVPGFLGKYVTSQKIDAVGCTGANWTAANLLVLMRKVYKSMPKDYRDDPGNVFMMAQVDLDLYLDSRSDMTSPSNVTREQVLTSGIIPNFMGHRLIAIPGWVGINEVHEGDSDVKGCILFGNPKNIDIASDMTGYRKNMTFNARASLGPAFEYTYDLYLDIQPARHQGFVIAYSGAKASTPYLVTSAGNLTGNSGEIATVSANKYNNSGANLDCAPYVDEDDCVLVTATETMAGASTLAAALQLANAAILPKGVDVTLDADAYIRAYHKFDWLTPSTQVMFDKAL